MVNIVLLLSVRTETKSIPVSLVVKSAATISPSLFKLTRVSSNTFTVSVCNKWIAVATLISGKVIAYFVVSFQM